MRRDDQAAAGHSRRDGESTQRLQRDRQRGEVRHGRLRADVLDDPARVRGGGGLLLAPGLYCLGRVTLAGLGQHALGELAVRVVHRLAQAAARHGLPVALDVELLDAAAQPVEAELGADAEVGACSRRDRDPVRLGEFDDVRRALQGGAGGHVTGERRRDAGFAERRGASVERLALEALQPARQRAGELADAGSQSADLHVDAERAAVPLQQPVAHLPISDSVSCAIEYCTVAATRVSRLSMSCHRSRTSNASRAIV